MCAAPVGAAADRWQISKAPVVVLLFIYLTGDKLCFRCREFLPPKSQEDGVLTAVQPAQDRDISV